MGKASRDKGATGERELIPIFTQYGFPHTWRTPNSGGLGARAGAGDLRGIEGLHVEVKRCERVEIDRWSAQAEGDCTPGDIPVVIYRRSRQPWRVVSLLEDFLVVYKRSTM